LFYGDEENNFAGMNRFLETHQGLFPERAISVCGGAGKALLACRGCIEIEFTIRGKSGHAARPHEGVSAVEAAVFVIDGLKRFVETANRHMLTQAQSSINFAAIHGGSVDTKVEQTSGRRIPAMIETANATVALAWFLIDVRPGSSEMTPELLIAEARALLCRFNAARPKTHHASFDSLESIDSIKLNFNRGPYASQPEKIETLFDIFRRVHKGAIESPETFGYIDIAELARTRNTALMCLSPEGGNIHAADEWVSTESVIAYRDCMVELLRHYKV
jgi:acetylornithine deacetylase/succinyl-diaminopimelate desuccinylase-like protein